MFRLIIFALISSALANTGCPTFNWMTVESEFGVPLLNIKFPDKQIDDYAVLRKSSSQPGCQFEGHLMFDKNATVKIKKQCEVENTFEIEIHSKRLVHTSFNVTDGIVKPIKIPTENKSPISGSEHLSNPPENDLILKIIAFYDLSFKSRFQSASNGVIQTIIGEVKHKFRLPSLVVPISLDLVEVKEVDSTISSENVDLLEVFENRGAEKNGFLFFVGETNSTINRSSKIGLICSSGPKERKAVVQWQDNIKKTAQVLAQEIGHLLGIGDDYEWNQAKTKIRTRTDNKNQSCTNINGIMDYYSDHAIWSSCSFQDFMNYYNTVKSMESDGEFCLKEKVTKYEKISGILHPGKKLLPNVRLESPHGYYYLILSVDGRLSLHYSKNDEKIWEPEVWSKGTTYSIMQYDGNFVMYDDDDEAKWATDTWDNGGAFLKLRDDGNLIIYSEDEEELWSSYTKMSTAEGSAVLTTLQNGESLHSANGEYFLKLQSDNDLVIRRKADNEIIWSSNTDEPQEEPTRAVFNADGNLILYDDYDASYWSTNTYGNPGASLNLLDNGTLVILAYDKLPLWSSDDSITTTDELSNEDSQTEELQTEESQTEESQTEESQTEESQTEESQTEESQTEDSQTEESSPKVQNENSNEKTTGYSKVAIAQGFNGIILRDDVEVIDLLSPDRNCDNLPVFPFPNYDAHGGLGIRDKPIICGGENNRSQCLSLQNGTWKHDVPPKHSRGTAAISGSPFPNDSSKLFVTGGYGKHKLTSEVLTENGWELSTPMPEDFSNHCMVKINTSTVMVIGGYQDKAVTGETDHTFFFNGITKVWSAGPKLKQKRTKHRCAMIWKDSLKQSKSVIVVGGTSGWSDYHDSTEVLDDGSTEWRFGPKLPFGILGAGIVNDPSGGVVLIGGWGDRRYLRTLFRLPHAGSEGVWERLTKELQFSRFSTSTFLIPDEIAKCH